MFLNNKTNFWSNYNNYSNFFPKTTIVIYTKLFMICLKSKLQHLECHLDDSLHTGIRVVLEDGTRHLGNGCWWIAQSLECFASILEHFLIDATRIVLLTLSEEGWRDAKLGNLVVQFHNDALGGLATQSLHGLEHLVVARHDDVAEFSGSESGQHGASRVATNATH